MKKTLFILAAAALALSAFASVAPAASSALRVIGKNSSSGAFTVTSASAKKKTGAIYIRGYGRNLYGQSEVFCRASSRSKPVSSNLKSFYMREGQLYRVPQPFAGDCDVIASLSGSGKIRLEILA
jgi:hypothetical protein